jgi:hypothetical protein
MWCASSMRKSDASISFACVSLLVATCTVAASSRAQWRGAARIPPRKASRVHNPHSGPLERCDMLYRSLEVECQQRCRRRGQAAPPAPPSHGRTRGAGSSSQLFAAHSAADAAGAAAC